MKSSNDQRKRSYFIQTIVMKQLFILISFTVLVNDLFSQNRETVFESSFTDLPPAKWTPGMKFIFQANYALWFYPPRKSKKTKSDVDNKIAIFKSWKPGTIDNAAVFEIDGELWTAHTSSSESMYIDGVAYQGNLQRVKDSLIGQTIFVLSNNWVQTDASMEQKDRQYFQAVINNVSISKSSFVPYRIGFTSESGLKGYLDIQIEGPNIRLYNDYKFSHNFSFSNPRDKYTFISDPNWALIKRGEVRPGMTKVECQLSYGQPKKINKTVTESEISEQWVYEGNYLYFVDDKLKVIQTN